MNKQGEAPAIIFWIIWGSILMGLFILQTFIIGGFHTGGAEEPVTSPLIAICLSGAIASFVVRWMVLPRQSSLATQLPTMIIGLALAESTGLLGMFLIGSSYPSLQLLTFFLSVLAVVQFMPVYAKPISKNAQSR